ncbi:MAG TPA: DUF2934 domain-containing protein [Candidatus Dormibacteraeota bacterium]|jgi:hypothetical protein|nr:DUF2934 domain-containing protein [Candidatus Dormibacteraeota bacterium]
MNTAIEDRIRNRAYELWEAEGRPEGREVDHWLRAAQEVSGEVAGETSAVGTSATRRPRTPRSASTATSPATRTPAAASPATRTPAAAAGRSRSRASKGTAPLS